MESRTYHDHPTGALLGHHFDADSRLVSGECRWCRQVVSSARLVGVSRRAPGKKRVCRHCREARHTLTPRPSAAVQNSAPKPYGRGLPIAGLSLGNHFTRV